MSTPPSHVQLPPGRDTGPRAAASASAQTIMEDLEVILSHLILENRCIPLKPHERKEFSRAPLYGTVIHYLDEHARVVRPGEVGGKERFFITLYIMEDEAKPLPVERWEVEFLSHEEKKEKPSKKIFRGMVRFISTMVRTLPCYFLYKKRLHGEPVLPLRYQYSVNVEEMDLPDTAVTEVFGPICTTHGTLRVVVKYLEPLPYEISSNRKSEARLAAVSPVASLSALSTSPGIRERANTTGAIPTHYAGQYSASLPIPTSSPFLSFSRSPLGVSCGSHSSTASSSSDGLQREKRLGLGHFIKVRCDVPEDLPPDEHDPEDELAELYDLVTQYSETGIKLTEERVDRLAILGREIFKPATLPVP